MAALQAARQVTQPLTELNEVGRRFAAGDHDAARRWTLAGRWRPARSLNDAADEVLVAEQARRNIAADVAHELRTPLAALQAGLEEMRDGLMPADVASLTRLHDQPLAWARWSGNSPRCRRRRLPPAFPTTRRLSISRRSPRRRWPLVNH